MIRLLLLGNKAGLNTSCLLEGEYCSLKSHDSNMFYTWTNQPIASVLGSSTRNPGLLRLEDYCLYPIKNNYNTY